MRRGSLGDEELRAVGAGARVGHRQDAGLVVHQPGSELVAEAIAGAAGAPAVLLVGMAAQRIAHLHHEAGDDPVKAYAVVHGDAALLLTRLGIFPGDGAGGEAHEVLDGVGSLLLLELDDDGPLRRLETCIELSAAGYVDCGETWVAHWLLLRFVRLWFRLSMPGSRGAYRR